MATPYKMKGSPMQRNFGISPMKKDESKMTAAEKRAASLAAAEKSGTVINVDGNKKKTKKRDTNADRAVANMQYIKDSANETFDADAYRKTLQQNHKNIGKHPKPSQY